jgi:hypothetical protein
MEQHEPNNKEKQERTKKKKTVVIKCYCVGRVWRYQRVNQNPYIEGEQTPQWPKGKVQKEKQRSTKHTYKTKDRVTRTPLFQSANLCVSKNTS